MTKLSRCLIASPIIVQDDMHRDIAGNLLAGLRRDVGLK
jgi:hypothetical protein